MSPQNRKDQRQTVCTCVSALPHRSSPFWRVRAVPLPSQELFDRAQAGWERFLDSFEEPPHE
ncbi:hypothetical protein BX286_1660 [Streptomyces sp. 3211.6]|nr:hypothetical protein BX286_1660 [Streptomyces sp. 3211.6]RPF39593.1 hypothetical protein EDD96_3337 [Streptomyces sp. Ag109_G2-6]